MNEKQITICGHGSNKPSTKNMFDYLTSRQSSKASNGKSKGLVEVVRFLETEEQRKQFHDTYKTILGRNTYDQNLRMYCYNAYKGKYYSDCSSSGCLTYEKCGIGGVSYYNTAMMHNKGKKIEVTIIDGHIAESDLSKLRVGDALLFRGNDPSRPLQIGHVEYIYELPTTLNGWVDEHYYENGVMCKKKWVKTNGYWYRVGNNGELLRGWHKIYDDNNVLCNCYFDEEDGALWHERDDKQGYLEKWKVEE